MQRNQVIINSPNCTNTMVTYVPSVLVLRILENCLLCECACVRACVRACARARARERERKRKTERDKERETETDRDRQTDREYLPHPIDVV